jgi:hypothetical protein
MSRTNRLGKGEQLAAERGSRCPSPPGKAASTRTHLPPQPGLPDSQANRPRENDRLWALQTRLSRASNQHRHDEASEHRARYPTRPARNRRGPSPAPCGQSRGKSQGQHRGVEKDLRRPVRTVARGRGRRVGSPRRYCFALRRSKLVTGSTGSPVDGLLSLWTVEGLRPVSQQLSTFPQPRSSTAR